MLDRIRNATRHEKIAAAAVLLVLILVVAL